MFNDHIKITKFLENAMEDCYIAGYNDNSTLKDATIEMTVEVVRGFVEDMQSQIDSLMLEYRRCRADKDCRYCPDEMSNEQLDNWAKNQKVVVDTNNTKLYINGELFEDTLKRFFHAS